MSATIDHRWALRLQLAIEFAEEAPNRVLGDELLWSRAP
jgi:hypothetical protein